MAQYTEECRKNQPERLTHRKLWLAERHLHLYRNRASARIAFNWSRSDAVSALRGAQLRQQFLGVAVVVLGGVRVFDVEVVAA